MFWDRDYELAKSENLGPFPYVFFLKDKLQFHLAILFNEAVEVSFFWAKFEAKRARYLINFICFLNAQVYGSYLSYNLKGGIFNAKVFLT